MQNPGYTKIMPVIESMGFWRLYQVAINPKQVRPHRISKICWQANSRSRFRTSLFVSANIFFVRFSITHQEQSPAHDVDRDIPMRSRSLLILMAAVINLRSVAMG